MDALESSVVDFTARQLSVRREKIGLESRLGRDLGVDGDDAVQFFDQFEKTFNVSLSNLRSEWGYHFGPEASFTGRQLFGSLICISLVLLALLLARQLPTWGLCVDIATAALSLIWVLVAGRQRLVDISINDLVNAAKNRKWPGIPRQTSV